ncbi:hypothetical protein niasHT_031977 [Heterodera trifolii]|uniref:Metalloprotease n=1 Tax=Heterodera trifolii TaxID=157864 RepID=A0ABD2IEK2_9BILA
MVICGHECSHIVGNCLNSEGFEFDSAYVIDANNSAAVHWIPNVLTVQQLWSYMDLKLSGPLGEELLYSNNKGGKGDLRLAGDAAYTLEYMRLNKISTSKLLQRPANLSTDAKQRITEMIAVRSNRVDPIERQLAEHKALKEQKVLEAVEEQRKLDESLSKMSLEIERR